MQGNTWEEHTYHYKFDVSQRKLKKIFGIKHPKSDREARIYRNIFVTAAEAHNLGVF